VRVICWVARRPFPSVTYRPCPACGETLSFEVAHSVLADRRPDLRTAIPSNRFQADACEHCGAHFRREPDLNYLDTGRGRSRASRCESTRRFARPATPPCQAVPPEARRPHLHRPHRHWYATMPRDEDDRDLDPAGGDALLPIETALA
jgi:hypothetical protein